MCPQRCSYLDNGVELTLKAGDTCVQRGTIHGWDNRTDKPARIFFILSGKSSKRLHSTDFAKPVVNSRRCYC